MPCRGSLAVLVVVAEGRSLGRWLRARRVTSPQGIASTIVVAGPASDVTTSQRRRGGALHQRRRAVVAAAATVVLLLVSARVADARFVTEWWVGTDASSSAALTRPTNLTADDGCGALQRWVELDWDPRSSR